MLVIGSYSGKSQPTLESINDISKQFIKALKKQDVAEFRFTYTNDSTVLAELSNSLGFNMGYALERDFIRIIKEGIEKGIEWNSIKLLKTEYEMSRAGAVLIAQPTQIIFEHRIFRYRIDMNCSKFKGNWSFVPIARKTNLIHLVPIGFEETTSN